VPKEAENAVSERGNPRLSSVLFCPRGHLEMVVKFREDKIQCDRPKRHEIVFLVRRSRFYVKT
jgi:hypothetical protein